MMRALRRLRSCVDRGAAAVEFAIISIPLFLLLFGIIQFGFTFYSQIMISQAAREGSRLISLDIATATPGTCDSSCITNAEDKMTSYAGPLVTLTGTSFSPAPTTCPAGSTQSSAATVTISYKVTIALLFPLTITGNASMPCGG